MGLTNDPYEIKNLGGEEREIGRNFFARSPGSDIWVSFGDLPEATRDALWDKHKHEPAFAADLAICRRKDVDNNEPMHLQAYIYDAFERLYWGCAVRRRRFPVGARPTRRLSLQPEATGAGMEETKCLKPLVSGSRIGDRASVQAAT